MKTYRQYIQELTRLSRSALIQLIDDAHWDFYGTLPSSDLTKMSYTKLERFYNELIERERRASK